MTLAKAGAVLTLLQKCYCPVETCEIVLMRSCAVKAAAAVGRTAVPLVYVCSVQRLKRVREWGCDCCPVWRCGVNSPAVH